MVGGAEIAGIVAAVGGVENFVGLWRRLSSTNVERQAWRAIGEELKAIGLSSVDLRLLKEWLIDDSTVRSVVAAQNDHQLKATAAEELRRFWIRRRPGQVAESEHAESVVQVLLRHLSETTQFEEHVLAHLSLLQHNTGQLASTLEQSAVVVHGRNLAEWISSSYWANHVRSHITGGAIPTYVRRSYDDELAARLRGALSASHQESSASMWELSVFLGGVSKSGKTRSLLEALRSLAQESSITIYHPTRRDFSHLAERVTSVGLDPSNDAYKVILLDDLQHFRPSDHLDESYLLNPLGDQLPTLLELCASPVPERIIVVGTVWSDHLNGTREELRAENIGGRNPEVIVRFRSNIVPVDVELDDTEFAVANHLLGEQIAKVEFHSVDDLRTLAPSMAAVPEMLAQVHRAFSGTSRSDRSQKALLQALLVAFLLNRTGVSRIRLRRILTELDAAVGDEAFDDAFWWGTTPLLGGTRCVAEEFGQRAWRLTDPLLLTVAYLAEVEMTSIADRVTLTAAEGVAAGDGLHLLMGGITKLSLPWWEQVRERHHESEDPETAERVAAALLKLGAAKGALHGPALELDAYDMLLHRFGESTVPEIRFHVKCALHNKRLALEEVVERGLGGPPAGRHWRATHDRGVI